MASAAAESHAASQLVKLLNLDLGQHDDLAAALQSLLPHEVAVVLAVSDSWLEQRRCADEPGAVLARIECWAGRVAIPGPDLAVAFFGGSGDIDRCRADLLRRYPDAFSASREAVQAGVLRSTAPTIPLAHTALVRRIGPGPDLDISHQQLFAL